MMRTGIVAVPSPHPLAGLLPGVYAEDDLTSRLLAAFDDAMAPAFLLLDNLTAYLDPETTPVDFLDWLGGWVCAVTHPAIPEPAHRELVARAVELHALRGTAAALTAVLRLVCGTDAEIAESGATTWSVDAGADAPGAAEPGLTVWIDADAPIAEDVLREVIDSVRPVHLPLRLEVRTTEDTA